MTRLTWWLFGLVWIGTSALHAQGLLDELNAVTEEPTLPVRATFKDTRIVNVQSNETVWEPPSEFVVAAAVQESGEGFDAI